MEKEKDFIAESVYDMYVSNLNGTAAVSRDCFFKSLQIRDKFVDISEIERISADDSEFIENAYIFLLNVVVSADIKEQFSANKEPSYIKRKKLIIRIINSEDFKNTGRRVIFNIFDSSENGSMSIKERLYIRLYEKYQKLPLPLKNLARAVIKRK